MPAQPKQFGAALRAEVWFIHSEDSVSHSYEQFSLRKKFDVSLRFSVRRFLITVIVDPVSTIDTPETSEGTTATTPSDQSPPQSSTDNVDSSATAPAETPSTGESTTI